MKPPTKYKVWEKIRTSKSNKSSGKDNSAELIKYGDKKLQAEIHTLTEIIWTSERMLEKWCTATTCLTHKKGDKL